MLSIPSITAPVYMVRPLIGTVTQFESTDSFESANITTFSNSGQRLGIKRAELPLLNDNPLTWLKYDLRLPLTVMFDEKPYPE